ncbi:MAG TPA: hypothetical protein VE988_25820 [Gemmataceae bacterium]|nr:hypothetical protein [Gemmataceae bacterium]
MNSKAIFISAFLTIAAVIAVPVSSQPPPQPAKKKLPSQDKEPAKNQQPPKDAKETGPLTLEVAKAKALKHNPEILIAVANVHGAELELNRVRLSAQAKTVIAKAELEMADIVLSEAEATWMQLNRLRLQHAQRVTDEELAQADSLVSKLRTEKTQKATLMKADPHNAKALVLVAEAKMQLAEAELGLVRQQVVNDVELAYVDAEASMASLNKAAAKLDRLKQLSSPTRNTIITKEEIASAESAVTKHKADVAKKKAALAYLLGDDASK